MNIRVGNGIDIHPFADGRKCIIGGVEIPNSRGLAGHSDADVLLHAVIDAILGATGQTDIGSKFPDTDPRHKDADSMKLLNEVWMPLKKDGWSIINLDCTVLAEVPKLKPYIADMRARIAKCLGCDSDRVTIKATTTEKLGFIGREEGILSMATVLISKENS